MLLVGKLGTARDSLVIAKTGSFSGSAGPIVEMQTHLSLECRPGSFSVSHCQVARWTVGSGQRAVATGKSGPCGGVKETVIALSGEPASPNQAKLAWSAPQGPNLPKGPSAPGSSQQRGKRPKGGPHRDPGWPLRYFTSWAVFHLNSEASRALSQDPHLHQLTTTMESKADLARDITFIETPPAKPSTFETGEDCGVPVTNVSIGPLPLAVVHCISPSLTTSPPLHLSNSTKLSVTDCPFSSHPLSKTRLSLLRALAPRAGPTLSWPCSSSAFLTCSPACSVVVSRPPSSS